MYFLLWNLQENFYEVLWTTNELKNCKPPKTDNGYLDWWKLLLL